MLPPKKEKSLAHLLIEASGDKTPSTVPQGLQLADHTQSITTSKSQYDKAAGSADLFEKVLGQVSAEQKATRDFEDAQATRNEGLLTPSDEKEVELKKDLGDESFKKHKLRKEELEKLNVRPKEVMPEKGKEKAGASGSFIGGLSHWITDLVSGTDDGKDAKQQDEYRKLEAEQSKDWLPTLRRMYKESTVNTPEKHKQVQELEATVKAKYEELRKSSFENGDESLFDDPELKKLQGELANLNLSLRYDEKNQKLLSDYLDGKNNIWNGVSNHYSDLATAGIASLLDNLQIKNLAEKTTRDGEDTWDELSTGEQEALKSVNKYQEVEQLQLMKDRGWYRTGDGTAQSLVFMEGMLLTRGAGGAAEGIAQQGLKSTLRGMVKAGTGKSIVRTTIGKGMFETSLVKGMFKILPAGAEIGTAAAISPSTYSNYLQDQTGGTRLVKDENGNDKILMRESIYKSYQRDYETAFLQIDEAEKLLMAKSNRSEAEEEELVALANERKNRKEDLAMIAIDTRVKSKAESLAYGFTETAKEYFAEKYVGEGFEKLGKSLGGAFTRNIGRIPLVGKPIAKGVKYVDEILKKGSNRFNNSMAGKISSKAMYHTGTGKLWNGIPAEMLEEVAVQAMPTINQDYVDQLKELANPTFYADVAAQTLLMGGMPVVLGGVGQAYNYKKNQKFYDARKSIRDSYMAIDKAVTDDDLAAQLIMSSGGTSTSIAEFDNQIAKLRSKGKVKEAGELEQKKFFNIASRAMQTNTLEEFEQSLDRKLKDPDSKLSADTITNITLAKQKIEVLKKTYDKYKYAPNAGEIVSLAADKITTKQTIENVDVELGKQALLAQEEIELLADGQVDFSMSTLFDREFENDADRSRYDTFLYRLQSSESPEIQGYLNLLTAKSNLKFAQQETMHLFNKAVGPTYMQDKKNIADFKVAMQTELSRMSEVTGSTNITNESIETAYNRVDKKNIPLQELKKIKQSFMDYNGVDTLNKQLDEVEKVNAYYEEVARQKEAEESQQQAQEEVVPNEPIIVNQDELGDPTTTTTEDNDGLGDISQSEIEASLRGEAEVILGATSTPTITSTEAIPVQQDSFDSYAPTPTSVENFDDTKKQAVKGAVKNVFDILVKTKGSKPSFQDLVLHLLNFIPEEQAESQFNAYKLGWEMNGYENTNFDDVYNNIFDPAKKITENALATISNLFADMSTNQVEVTAEELAQDSEKQLKEIENNNVPILGFTEENIPVKAIGGNRTIEVEGSLGYSALEYDEIQDENGVWRRETKMTNSLNFDEDSIIDFRPMLDPDKMIPGTKLQVKIAPQESWGTIKSVVGRDDNGVAILKSFAQILAEKEAVNPNYRNTKEFNDSVPILVFDGNTPVAHIHDVSWYNAFNVGDPTNAKGTIDTKNITPSHNALIQKGKQNASDLRNQIISNGLKEITVKEKREGAFYTIDRRRDAQGELIPFYTINEANPQAIIATAMGGSTGFVEVSPGVPFENDKRKLVSDKIDSGHTYNLRRIGVDPSDGKEVWRAFKVIREVTDEQLETVRWAWAAHARLNESETTRNGVKRNFAKEIYQEQVVGTKYELTEEQAQKIIDDIRKTTGFRIDNFQDAKDFFKLYFQPRKISAEEADGISNFGKTLYKQEKGFFAQHTLNKKLGSKENMVHIDNMVVKSLDKPYSEYLKDTLKTGVKSFNVGTEANPIYATSVQPTITFSYEANSVEETTPQNRAIVIEQAMEAAKQEVGITANVDTVLKGFNELRDSLGFTPINYTQNTNIAQSPVEMNGVENLKNIFKTTKGLTIGQEGHIIKFVYNYISSAIDIKYKSKINKAELERELESTYDKIIEPSKKGMNDYLKMLTDLNSQDERVVEAIKQAQTILETFDNIKKNWSAKDVQAEMEAVGETYTGQLGILDKAMAEVSKTSDIKQENKIDDEADKVEKDNSERTASYDDDASLVESGKQKTTYRLRRFMAGIERLNDDFSAKTGFLKLPEYVGFNEVFDTLYQLLGDGVYIESDYETMKAKISSMEVAYPWVKQFIEKLDKADLQVKNEFVTNYRKHAISMKFAMYTTGANGTQLQVYDTNANEIKRVILDTWKNNFKTSPLVGPNNSINKDVARALLTQLNTWPADKTQIPDTEVKDWLANFGIVLSDKYFEELKQVGFQGKRTIPYQQMFSGSTNPIGGLKIYLENTLKKDFTNFEEVDQDHPFGDMNNIMKTLTAGEARYTPKTINKSFRDAGKNVSGVTVPNFITNRIDDLKRSVLTDGQFVGDLQSLSLTQDSLLLEMLTGESDFVAKFGIEYLGITAFKEFGKKANNFSSLRDLNDIDHDMIKLTGIQDTQQEALSHRKNGFTMRMGRMFLPTMSDKKQMLMLKTGIFNFMEESNYAFKKVEGKTAFTEDLRELLYNQLVLPELKRIYNFHNKGGKTNVANYDKAAQIFNFIPALNNVKDSNGIRLIKHLAVADEKVTLESIEELFKESMMDVVEEVAHDLAKEKMEIWRPTHVKTNNKGETTSLPFFDAKYVAKGKGDLNARFENATYDYVLNYMISNINSFTLLSGDPAMYSKDGLFPKDKAPFDIENDSDFITISTKMGTNLGKRLALMIAPGVTLANAHKQQYLQVFLRDETQADKTVASNADYLIKLYHGQEGLDKAQPLLDAYDKAISENDITTAIANRQQLKAMFSDIADYFDIDASDAQEYSTIHEHLIILEDLGRVTREQSQRIFDTLEAGKDLTKEDLSLVFQPIKPVVSSQIIDKDQDLSRVMYIKSSSFPLIPQLTAGTKLDGLRKTLEVLEGKHGIPVRASYGSANKVGAVTNPIDPYNSASLATAELSMMKMNRNDFRIQQDVPYKSDNKAEKVSMGTQIFKLLMGDNMINLDGFNVDGKNMNGSELYDYFNEAFTNLVNIKKTNLFRELGLSDEGEIVDEKEFISNLQQLLEKEAIKRDYPIQDIKGLELDTLYDYNGNPYYEFKVPLWLSTNSNRYESLLNSIVSNRIMSHKLPGSSFVVGAETGFGFSEDMSNIDKSRIIYLDGWDGKALKGVSDVDGNFSKAQVFVPSKFKISDKVLIDLFEDFDNETKEGKYIYRRENGTLGLKEGMIDPELLNQFSFRTPTSSHVSGATIEIAGILPPEVGDLMIVPKNFTKQKGLDYDVDKETAYQLNYVVDNKTGKISVLTEKHKENELKTLRRLLFEENAAIDSEFGNPALQAFNEIIRFAFGDTSDDLLLGEELAMEAQNMGAIYEDKIKKIEARYDEKLMENKFIKAHLAIYNNANPEVQKKINKVLSMSFAEGQADFIEGLTEEARKNAIEKESIAAGNSPSDSNEVANSANNSFTILSDEYQKQKMSLGSAGKMAISIYSNYVTFHGLTQQVGTPLQLKDGKENHHIFIGNMQSNGVLGEEMTLDGKRSIAEVLAEKQNTATDNEKAQILGRVNVNSTTIGVDSLLTLLGFDQDINGNSISYTLLSQPILKEYVKRLDNGKGITAEYNKDLEENIIKDLVKQFSNGEFTVIKENTHYVFFNQNKEKIEGGHSLDGDSLVEGIKSNGQNAEIQITALQQFLELNSYAKSIGKVQTVVNTNDLGKSIVESNVAYERLKTFSENIKIANVSGLIGEFIPIEEGVTEPEKYNVVGDYYVRATTPQGQIVVNGLVTGQKLWTRFFPYGDTNFKYAIDEMLSLSEVNADSESKTVEVTLEAIQEIKKYIYSWRGLGIFDEKASSERQRLFIDTSTKQSLATYMNGLQGNPIFKDNKLLSKFTYEVQVDGRPSLIKFNNTDSDNFDEQYLYNSLAELIVDNRPLPEWNGKVMDSKSLAQELITYSYVEGGLQEAIQFIKYVPVEYLSEVGLTIDGRFVPSSEILQRMSLGRNPNVFQEILQTGNFDPKGVKTLNMVKQYIQHNPEKAKRVSNDKGLDFEDATQTSFVYNSEEKPKFIVRKGVNPKSKLKQDKYRLYENTGSNQFQEIDILGTTGMNEYEFGNNNAKTILGEKVNKPVVAGIVAPEVNLGQSGQTTLIQQGDTVEQALQKVANSKFGVAPHLVEAAKVLLPMIDKSTVLSFEDTTQIVEGGAKGLYVSAQNKIIVDSNMVKGVDQTAKVFLHEFVHSISMRELKKYYDVNGTEINDNAPQHVKNLDKVWKAFKSALPAEALARIEQARVDYYIHNKPMVVSNEDAQLAYGAMNIFEFMTIAMESDTFQEEMSKIEYEPGKSIADKFREIILQILSAINPSIADNNIASASLKEILNFITEENEIKKEKKAIFEAPEYKSEDGLAEEILAREQAEQAYYDSLDNVEDDTNDDNTVALMPSNRLPEIKNCD